MKELDKFVDKILAHKPKRENKNEKEGRHEGHPKAVKPKLPTKK